jgi:tetratricopeptide (TPR) repeat protein
MERKKYILFTLLLVFVTLWLADTPSRQMKVYRAYVSNGMDQWKVIVDKMQKVDNPQLSYRFEMLNYQYGYIAYLIGKEKNDEAEKYLKNAWDNLEFLEDKDYQLASIYGYRSAFYGYEIGLNAVMAPYYGPKSMRFAKKAIEKDPSDPMGFTQYANIQFYMPAAFGGSKKEAVEYYQKAITKMEARKKWRHNWNYLSLLATYGQALEALDKNQEAFKVYKKALSIEPDFQWIKIDLLPKLKKKIENED